MGFCNHGILRSGTSFDMFYPHMDGASSPCRGKHPSRCPLRCLGKNSIKMPGQNPIIQVPAQAKPHPCAQVKFRPCARAKPHPCARTKPHPEQEPILILPGQLPGQNLEVTPMPHPLSGITPPPFAFALAFARAYARTDAWAKARTFLKVFDGNNLQ